MYEYITILNNSLESISFYVYFYKDISLKELIGIKTEFFGNTNFKTVAIPKNSIDITISLRIKTLDKSIIWAKSLKLKNAASKTYQFIGSENHSMLFEIDPINIKNANYIYIKNKSSNEIKENLIFNIGKETINEKSKIIKKNNNLYVEVPFNSINIKLSIYMSNFLGIWTKANTIIFPKTPIKKCYEITDKNFIESTCSK